MPMGMRFIFRLLLGPLVVAMFAGIRLEPYGLMTSAAGAYLTFTVAQAAIVAWGRYQLRLARRRAAARRQPTR